MRFEHPPKQLLAEVAWSAGEFGLTSDEVWETVMATPDRLPTDLRARYIDELTGELARRLLEKERASQNAPPSTHHRVPPRRSPLVDPGVIDRTGLARRCLGWAGCHRKRAAAPPSAGMA